MEEYLRRRVRYFTDGAVIGSQTFLEEVFIRAMESFGKKRKSGARRMRGLADKLYSVRDLQTDLGS